MQVFNLSSVMLLERTQSLEVLPPLQFIMNCYELSLVVEQRKCELYDFKIIMYVSSLFHPENRII